MKLLSAEGIVLLVSCSQTPFRKDDAVERGLATQDYIVPMSFPYLGRPTLCCMDLVYCHLVK